MKEKLNELLEEIRERKDYYLNRADNDAFKDYEQNSIGHYIELKNIEESILEILGEDNDRERPLY